jgi:hypothetical protein
MAAVRPPVGDRRVGADRGQPASRAGTAYGIRRTTRGGRWSMIRPLRRRHRWIIPVLFLVVLAAALVALVRPAPSARVETLPSSVASLDEPVRK